LGLGGNKLSTIPDSIGNLTNLTSLGLWGNKLSTFPKWIANLTNLEGLYLSDNQLSTLSESIGNLTNLTKLGLSGNKLSTIPESIGNLTNLCCLELSDNVLRKISDLPQSVQDLIDKNELECFEENEDEEDEIPTVKLVSVGEFKLVKKNSLSYYCADVELEMGDEDE
jgi:Leucine-rich repeat (LRR) protein